MSLAACGSKKENGSADSGNGAAADVKTETYDVGAFTVEVPEGWFIAEQSDYTEDADDEGNYPVSETSIGLIKDGESEWDALDKPTLYIYLQEDSAENQAEFVDWLYEEYTELDVTLNGTKCFAYEEVSDFGDDDVYTYDDVYIPIDDSQCFQCMMMVGIEGYEDLSVTDAEVLAIMESITLK